MEGGGGSQVEMIVFGRKEGVSPFDTIATASELSSMADEDTAMWPSTMDEAEKDCKKPLGYAPGVVERPI